MCGLFGFSIYNEDIKNYNKLLKVLSIGASERGTDSTGIAYNKNKVLTIYKKPLRASKMDFKHLPSVRVVTGHTRHATQGKSEINRNNHPFKGRANNKDFALAHNGIIWNDHELQQLEHLPETKILTDSYIMTQLIEKYNKLDFSTLAKCTELLEGYYTFTLLDSEDNLYIIKGDSPLSIVKLTRLKMFVYASTDEILYNALMNANLFNEIKKGYFEIVNADEGDILKIDKNGKITKGNFKPFDYSRYNRLNWYDYGFYNDLEPVTYIDDLKGIAKNFGYEPEEIDALINDGFTPDEIEEYLYTGDLI